MRPDESRRRARARRALWQYQSAQDPVALPSTGLARKMVRRWQRSRPRDRPARLRAWERVRCQLEAEGRHRRALEAFARFAACCPSRAHPRRGSRKPARRWRRGPRRKTMTAREEDAYYADPTPCNCADGLAS